jgi:hypothetical protein
MIRLRLLYVENSADPIKSKNWKRGLFYFWTKLLGRAEIWW